MFYGVVQFEKIPEIGFAHHFYTDKYAYSYNHPHNSFEIAYIKSGELEISLHEKKILATEGSVLVLFRHLPITTRTIGNDFSSHCTVQAEFGEDYDFLLTDNPKNPEKLILPFVIPPCPENEKIKKSLYSIVSDMGTSRQEHLFKASVEFVQLMKQIDTVARKNLFVDSPQSSIIVHKVKSYITDNIASPITLSDISNSLGLSASYINHIFKKVEGSPIKQYVNNEKAIRITELIQTQQMSFKTACNNVGITDCSYGYRLFKKHIGMTPKSFEKSNFLNK